MIRFRTGDLTRVLPGPCPCGRTFRRISRILGRTDDMLIIRGTNVFPSQIEAVILEVEEAPPRITGWWWSAPGPWTRPPWRSRPRRRCSSTASASTRT